MEDRDFDNKFPYAIAFLVTGASCLGFRYFMKLLHTNLPSAFYWIGMISICLGCVACIISFFSGSEKQYTVERRPDRDVNFTE